MRSLISHLRYTFRLLLKSPGFTVPAVLILALGIGANAAIFSLINGVLFKTLPYSRLVTIYQVFPGLDKFSVDYLDYLDLRRDQRTFEALSAYTSDDLTIRSRSD
jgi:putative ABC transport system permease protein